MIRKALSSTSYQKSTIKIQLYSIKPKDQRVAGLSVNLGQKLINFYCLPAMRDSQTLAFSGPTEYRDLS